MEYSKRRKKLREKGKLRRERIPINLGDVVDQEKLEYIRWIESSVYGNDIDNLAIGRNLVTPPKGRKNKVTRNFKLDGLGLTPREREFIRSYCDEESPTYRHGILSAYKAYNVSSDATASGMANIVLKRGRVRMALAKYLKDYDDEIQDKIVNGIRVRLEDPEKAHWLPTADFYAKIKGEYAPDKQVVMSLSPEEREERYEEIKRKITEAKERARLAMPIKDDEPKQS